MDVKKGKRRSKEISTSVSKWIGVLNTRRTYKQLRGEGITPTFKKYKSAQRYNIGKKDKGIA